MTKKYLGGGFDEERPTPPNPISVPSESTIAKPRIGANTKVELTLAKVVTLVIVLCGAGWGMSKAHGDLTSKIQRAESLAKQSAEAIKERPTGPALQLMIKDEIEKAIGRIRFSCSRDRSGNWSCLSLLSRSE